MPPCNRRAVSKLEIPVQKAGETGTNDTRSTINAMKSLRTDGVAAAAEDARAKAGNNSKQYIAKGWLTAGYSVTSPDRSDPLAPFRHRRKPSDAGALQAVQSAAAVPSRRRERPVSNCRQSGAPA